MPKSLASYLTTLLLMLFTAHAVANQHGDKTTESHAAAPEEAATFSIRQNDAPLCESPFWISLYELTVEVFAVGADKVQVRDFEEKLFAWVRASDEFPGDSAEAFVEHVKDIPRQLIVIIREDSSVLDSCANFSVALVGPP